jgi:hypothetical protein
MAAAFRGHWTRETIRSTYRVSVADAGPPGPPPIPETRSDVERLWPKGLVRHGDP